MKSNPPKPVYIEPNDLSKMTDFEVVSKLVQQVHPITTNLGEEIERKMNDSKRDDGKS